MEFTINDISFKNNLYQMRIDHHKTASEVAQFLCISRMQYYRYEKDLTPVPAKVVASLALYYNYLECAIYKASVFPK